MSGATVFAGLNDWGDGRTWEDVADQSDDPWWDLGHWFGYPTCCVEAFCRGDHLEMAEEERDEHWWCGTGFVPCKHHMEWDVEKMVEHINMNRSCSKKFAVVTGGKVYGL